ncbi:MAG: hypothetical protein PHC75_02765 [Burkholderiales bacterium]|nr:hypothetical protein [Burkholderiales bacterium]
MKKLLLITVFCFGLFACATNNSGSANNSVNTYGNQPDSPMVGSRAASSVEFPEENQLTP